MRETRVVCDKCGQCIIGQASTLDLRCGPAREALGESIDLCQDCAAALTSFVKGGRPELPSDLPRDVTPAELPADTPAPDYPPVLARSATTADLVRRR